MSYIIAILDETISYNSKVSSHFKECFHHEILPDVDLDVKSVIFEQKSYFLLNRDGLFHDIVIS